MANPLYGQNKADNAIDNISGEIKHIKPTADGTHIAAAETVILASSDAGNRYFVDISANTASFRLPSAYSNRGMEVHFHLSIASDAEGTKDFILFTNAATEYIMGVCIDGGGVHDQPSDDDFIQIDSSDGAVGAGDRVQVICDGHHWYVLEGSALTAGAWNTGTATRA